MVGLSGGLPKGGLPSGGSSSDPMAQLGRGASMRAGQSANSDSGNNPNDLGSSDNSGSAESDKGDAWNSADKLGNVADKAGGKALSMGMSAAQGVQGFAKGASGYLKGEKNVGVAGDEIGEKMDEKLAASAKDPQKYFKAAQLTGKYGVPVGGGLYLQYLGGKAAGAVVQDGLEQAALVAQNAAAAVSSNPIVKAVMAVKSAAGKVGGFFAKAGAMLKSGFSSAASLVVKFTGASTVTANIIVASFIGGTVTAGAVPIFSNSHINTYDRTVSNDDCLSQVKLTASALGSGSGDEIPVEAKQEETAKKIYSVFKTWGLNDTTIAAILGNWAHESGIDNTSMEGIFGEPQHMGPRKVEANNNMSAWTQSLSSYHANPSGYDTPEGPRGGIGLGQWTRGNNLRLQAVAKQMNMDWWELEPQLALVLVASPTGYDTTQLWNEMNGMGVDEATRHFLIHWEGINDGSLENRQKFASEWLGRLSGWSVDGSYAQSIISMAKTIDVNAKAVAMTQARSSCARSTSGKYDNSSIVSAALSAAYPTFEESKQGPNDKTAGTDVYVNIRNHIFPNDPISNKDCGRFVSAVVRWSGGDDDFPIGPTSAQQAHMASSDKWAHVGNLSSMKYEDLQPGDIGVNAGHVFIFVGKEAVVAKYPDRTDGSDVAEASQGERTGGIGVGWEIQSHQSYEIFRLVKPDNSSKYKGAADSTWTPGS